MFAKILIANRGEIAARVIRTARAMGLGTVAVYSEADAGALHVALADQAVPIGPAPARDSYLRADRIIEAARATGAEAIHPGYGFLSENPEFVDAVTAAGLTFIGPSAEAIRKMGLKDAAKRLMVEAGVPVVPGYHGTDQEFGTLAGAADEIGYPVLIKAAAGGGGKGMRRVDDPTRFGEAMLSARREAEAAFGDGRLLVEKFVTAPRHIEIQVFGDGERAIHLFERDCSLQRRHQKVIEEAPAPGMTDEMRAAMGAAAIRAAEAIGYKGAGTVEFIVDGSDGLRPDRFFFMEMNTRLQVEHPVTEAVTGIDLVEWQIRVAAGAPLPCAQEDLRLDGHAIEARLYAEDPARGFLPATGRLDHLAFPAAGVRVDSGVRQGDRITPHYDPMIAKLIVHGPDRAAALAKLRRALAATEVAGTVTNRAFLAALAAHPGFAAGDLDTGLIDRDLAALTVAAEPTDRALALAGIAALGLAAPSGAPLFGARDGWRLWGTGRQLAQLSAGDRMYDIWVTTLAEGRFRVALPGGETEISARLDGKRLAFRDAAGQGTATAVRHGAMLTLFLDGAALGFEIADPVAPDADAAGGGDIVTAPMTGLIKTVAVTPGATVSAGAPVAVMEAMKMEHALKAPRDGTVAEVLIKPGDQVDEAALLIRLEAEDG